MTSNGGPNVCNRQGNTPLHLSCGRNTLELEQQKGVIGLLLRHGAMIHLKNINGFVPSVLVNSTRKQVQQNPLSFSSSSCSSCFGFVSFLLHVCSHFRKSRIFFTVSVRSRRELSPRRDIEEFDRRLSRMSSTVQPVQPEVVRKCVECVV